MSEITASFVSWINKKMGISTSITSEPINEDRDDIEIDGELDERGIVYIARDALEKVIINWEHGLDNFPQSHMPSGLEIVIASE